MSMARAKYFIRFGKKKRGEEMSDYEYPSPMTPEQTNSNDHGNDGRRKLKNFPNFV